MPVPMRFRLPSGRPDLHAVLFENLEESASYTARAVRTDRIGWETFRLLGPLFGSIAGRVFV